MPLPIGILAFQGDVREHAKTLRSFGEEPVLVKTLAELKSVGGLIIPGGESTTIQKLSQIFGLFEPIRDAISNGLPVFGTCAGLIMLADQILDGIPGQVGFGGLDVTVRRNAFGHQTESFETDLKFEGIEEPVHAAFIRAPIIESVGPKTRVLATLEDGRIVGAAQDNLLGISFHPEVTGENRIHRHFVASARKAL